MQPAPYPIPDDGPVGDLLKAAGRGPMRPRTCTSWSTRPATATLITHIFVAGDQYLDGDAVFGVKDSLIAEFTEHAAGHRAGRPPRWTRLGIGCSYDIVLRHQGA